MEVTGIGMHSTASAADFAGLMLASEGSRRSVDSLVVHAPALSLQGLTIEDAQADQTFDGTLIKPGVFTPGIGVPDINNGEPVRIRIGAALIERLAPTMAGKPINLEHSRSVEDEVGVVESPHVIEGALKARLHFQAKRSRFLDAVAFINGRVEAKQVPNLSVEFKDPVFRPVQDGEADLELVDASEFRGVALLSEGACSDRDGCGIGLSSKQGSALHLTVLAPRGQRQQNPKGEPNMGEQSEGGSCTCGGGKDAELKKARERVAELEASLRDKDAALTEATEQVEDLKTKVGEFETAQAAELSANIRTALGFKEDSDDAKKAVVALTGEKPSLEVLQTVNRTLTATGGKGDLGFRRGRATTEAPREAKTAPAGEGQDEVLAFGQRHGLPKESGLPARLQRNTRSLLTTAKAQEGAGPQA